MPSENITIKSKMNPSKFMGSSHAAGSSLEKRVSNNERKITSIKNILKIRRSNLAENLRPLEPKEEENNNSQNIGDRLRNIAQALGVIGKLFLSQLGFNKKQSDEERKNLQDSKRKAREAKLESQKGERGIIPKAISKPALSFFDKLKKFFLNIVMGVGVMKIFKWLNDPANQEKIKSFSEFLIKHAPWIVGGLAAIALLPIVGGLAGLIGGIVGGIALLGGVIPLLPVILKVLVIGALAALTVTAAKWFWNQTRKFLNLRKASGTAKGSARDELKKAGVTGLGWGNIWNVKRDGGVAAKHYRALTDDEKAAVDVYKSEMKRIKSVNKAREEEIKKVYDPFYEKYSYEVKKDGTDPEWARIKGLGTGQSMLPPEKKKEWEIIKETINQKYDSLLLNSSVPSTSIQSSTSNVDVSSSTSNVDVSAVSSATIASSSITTPTISPPPSKGGVGGMMKVPTGDSSGSTSQGIEGSRSGSGLSKFSSTDPNKSTVAEESIYFS